MNGRKKRNGKMPGRGPGAGQKLVTYARTDLHDAGLDLFPFFETMLNPEGSPPMRVPDNHAGRTAVFKTPFVDDLSYSGVWDPVVGSSSIPDPVTPVDGYSEVILIPGSTACIIHTAGVEQVLWLQGDALDPNQSLVPILTTHPVDTDTVNGKVQLFQGLRFRGPTAAGMCLLPKANSAGNAVFEVLWNNPIGVDFFEIFIYATNMGISVITQTVMTITVRDNLGAIFTVSHNVISDNDSTVPFVFLNTASVIDSFWVEVDDLDLASHWVFTTGHQAVNSDFDFRLPAHSACNFVIENAP